MANFLAFMDFLAFARTFILGVFHLHESALERDDYDRRFGRCRRGSEINIHRTAQSRDCDALS